MFIHLSRWTFLSSCVCVPVISHPRAWGGIIHVSTSLALSCVRRAEANGSHVSKREIFCVTPCWHADIYRNTGVFVGALITVTADLQIARNPGAVSICSASSQWMGGIRRHTRVRSRTDFHRNAVKYRCRSECTHTHTHIHTVLEWLLKGKRSKTQIGCCDNTLTGKWLKMTESDIVADWPVIYNAMIMFSSPK